MTMASENPASQDLDPRLKVRREAWIGRVNALVSQLEQWARSAGWEVQRIPEQIEEAGLGTYQAPGARIQLGGPPGRPGRAVLVTPIALQVPGGEGRVDLEGYPTLSRVKLLGTPGGWKIMTDSNVPLRLPWDANTFRQLAEDLVA